MSEMNDYLKVYGDFGGDSSIHLKIEEETDEYLIGQQCDYDGTPWGDMTIVKENVVGWAEYKP